VEVRIEFLPNPHGAESIAKQIKQSGRAYPLFGAGRLFLEQPERHRVRISSVDPTVVLYQIGDGPIALDQASLEQSAFRTMKDQYYKEEIVLGEEIKGKFTNIARSRTTGTLLGPTNYHSYQPALRRLYDERFSRRMSFQEFLQMEIEIRTDEQSINDWKEQARSTTTYVTTQEAEPITFKSLAEAEQHFRKTYLPGMIKAGLSLECSGPASRLLPDRGMSNAMRDAWERERGFPSQLVNNLRPYLLDAGLHFFKHRKRILYIASVKPVRHAAGQTLSTGVASILSTIEQSPKCTRRDLARKILGELDESPEALEKKAALARDLHYLLHSGNVIEFHDGTLELPLVPGGQQPPQGGKPGAPAKGKPAAGSPAKAPAGDEDAAIDEEEAGAAEIESPTEPAAADSGEESPAGSLALIEDPASASLAAVASALVEDSAPASPESEPPEETPAAADSPVALEPASGEPPAPAPAESDIVPAPALAAADLPEAHAPVESLSAGADVSASSVVDAHLAEVVTLETRSITTGIITSADAPPAPVAPMNAEVFSESLVVESTFAAPTPAFEQTGALQGEPTALDQSAVHHSLVGSHESASALPGAESLADESENTAVLTAPSGLTPPASEPPPTA
jgi:hypothetical protein